MRSLLVWAAVTAALVFGPLTAGATQSASLPRYSVDTVLQTISEARGQVVVLNFWATWCAGCREEIPELVALREKYADHEVLIVGLSLDTDPGTVRAFLERFPVNYRMAHAAGDIQMLYDLTTIPKTIVYGPKGQKQLDHTGFMSTGDLTQTIDPLLTHEHNN
ncbi:TlpA family protein disulfide reductase [Desulfohalobium retbaense]|uniref:Redoxin domain protein n=1 Tax=Desulfohalobium retbaense (strain ATCC 49708 / DSM 5692 / JCM 16813 / HR100) TaxID=485915 RepID=C8X154_DESRD|nr:TlpA disulfide reductase family protein [Desulfohalobium retbaense]ACV68151.1 Redoxin domain protein [Desulfohalobium retbaense DSM 5692]